MAPETGRRKTNFEIVPKPDLAPERVERPQRILSVSYDESLAQTREMLLSTAGYSVATYMDPDRALHACQVEDFDLIVIGHSIPTYERKRLLEEVRRACSTPVLALLRHGDAPLAEADYTFDASQSPAQLLELVVEIFEEQRSKGR